MKYFKYFIIALTVILLLGTLIPDNMVIPVKNASHHDWNHDTFWFEPWGTSGVHKGIDIFGRKGTPVIASTSGLIVFAGTLDKGGNAIAILGPKWRIHYFSHLEGIVVESGSFVSTGATIGTLGDSGNAKGKPPHVHYSILSILPMPWLVTTETQGWKKMFYLNPYQVLSDRAPN